MINADVLDVSTLSYSRFGILLWVEYMKTAEFEEKEYEAYLYTELEQGGTRFWAPGQVLEHYLGFDRGIFVAAEYLWRLKGFVGPRRGISPYYFLDVWPDFPRTRDFSRRVPRFRLNCFVQAKRPSFGTRLPVRLRALGHARFYYRFDVDAEQQQSIEVVARRLADRALFVYAAPVYHTARDLFRHSIAGDTVEHSTFPDIVALTAHNSWYYNAPGGSGILNEGFARFEGTNLQQKIAALRESVEPSELTSQSQELASLAGAIRAAVTEGMSASPRAANLADEWRTIDAYSDRAGAQPVVRHFLEIAAFSAHYNLSWLAVPEYVT